MAEPRVAGAGGGAGVGRTAEARATKQASLPSGKSFREPNGENTYMYARFNGDKSFKVFDYDAGDYAKKKIYGTLIRDTDENRKKLDRLAAANSDSGFEIQLRTGPGKVVYQTRKSNPSLNDERFTFDYPRNTAQESGNRKKVELMSFDEFVKQKRKNSGPLMTYGGRSFRGVKPTDL